MLTHGGDTVGFARRYGFEPLDFSVNTNPFGLSPGAGAALQQLGAELSTYPDPLYRSLRSAIAHHEQLPAEWIACGNGAADLIWRVAFALRPQRALVTAPTFSEYETALDAVGCRTEHHLLKEENGFRLQEDILSAITEETELLFLCNPNNPTGATVPQPLLLQILERCRACHVLLVADECFLGFLRDAEARTLKPQLAAYPELLILKAFTKLYGMAGLRLGYCLSSSTGLLERLGKAGQCWPVSVPAQAAGIAALEDQAFVRRTLAFLEPERERMRLAMEVLGLRVFPGEANYLLFRTELPDYHERLAERGFLIRDCSNYAGLGEGYYRIAVLTPEKNDLLLAAMKSLSRNAP